MVRRIVIISGITASVALLLSGCADRSPAETATPNQDVNVYRALEWEKIDDSYYNEGAACFYKDYPDAAQLHKYGITEEDVDAFYDRRCANFDLVSYFDTYGLPSR